MPLPLDLTGLVDGTGPANVMNAADVTVPLNQIKTFAEGLETSIAAETLARTNLRDGVDAFNQLNLGSTGASTLTIASDAITITRSRHIIDTQGGAATDDLRNITGFTNGDVLVLQIVSAAKVVTIKHLAGGTGEIFCNSQVDVLLDHPSKMAFFIYDNTGTNARWTLVAVAQQPLMVRGMLNTSPVNVPTLTVPDRTLGTAGQGAPRLEVVPSLSASNRVSVRAAGSTIQGDLAAITVSGTPSAANQVESSYSTIVSAATLAAAAGWNSPYDQLQRRYNPYMEIFVRSPASFPAARWFIGFFGGAPGNADDPAFAAIGLRYSTVAADSGWKIIMDDGSSLSLHGTDLTPYSDNTNYFFRLRVDGSGGGIAYFSVNNGTEIAVSAGMVGSATNLGFACLAYTNAAVAKNILFRSAEVAWA